MLVVFWAEVFRENPIAGVHADGGTDGELVGISSELSALCGDSLPPDRSR